MTEVAEVATARANGQPFAVAAYGPGLLPQHAALLAASAISPEVAAERGYRSVTKKAELEALGFGSAQRRTPALLIPIWGVDGELAAYQARPDEPRIRDGKPVKYETPAGTRMVLDVPRRVREKLGDPSVPLLLTEGARKADAAVSRDLCCVALLGVWNWRGTNEAGGKVALADFERIALNGRRVDLVFDSDVTAKAEVHAALSRLKTFLERRGAEVLVVYLPAGEGGAKVGLDDFFAAGKSVDELFALAAPELHPLAGAQPPAPYEATPAGIRWHKRTGDGAVPIPLTNFTATIVAERAEDDGSEVRRVFEIEATRKGRLRRFSVPARDFPGLSWVAEKLGAAAVVYPGIGLRDHARAAIQLLSGEVPEAVTYAHTGWRALPSGAFAYLHAGGALGAGGTVLDVAVELAPPLDRFELPEPPRGRALAEAVRDSLALIELAPELISVPLLGGVYRAPLGEAPFSLHLAGPTGAGKTVLAALAQQHYGPALGANSLPASWSSTANALETIAFRAKDALLVVDDFVPQGGAGDCERVHREADRLLRAQGNRSGRARLSADASLRAARVPRGLLVSTGEDVPRGQSLRSRLLVLELGPRDLAWGKQLDRAQQAGEAGILAGALAGYLRWLAPAHSVFRERLGEEVARLRAAAAGSACHRRTPEIVAHLALGFGLLLDFALETGSISDEEADGLWRRGWVALGRAADAQAGLQGASDPARRFLELLSAAIASDRAHVASRDGMQPSDTPEAWGWRRDGLEYRPIGNCVGWLDGDDLYLEPDASFAAARSLAPESLTVTPETLRKRLNEAGYLASRDEARRELTARRTLEGTRRKVLHLRAELVGGPAGRVPDPAWSAAGRHVPTTANGSTMPVRPSLVGLGGFSEGRDGPAARSGMHPSHGAGPGAGGDGAAA